jgi:hypothetical protein
MCEITTTMDRGADLTVKTIRGVVTAQELVDALTDFYTHEPTLLALWDFSEATLDGLTSSDLKIISQVTRTHASLRAGGRTALLFSTQFAYGMGRMYDQAQNARGLPVEHMSFLDRDAALRWLRGGKA